MSCQNDGPRTATDCTPCSPGIRNRYFRGKLLTVADYEAEQRYAIQRRRLVNRQMLGWGVVSGFRIVPAEGGAEDRPIEIGAGLAFDRRGRELAACETVRLRDPTDVVWLSKGRCGLEPGKPPKEPAPGQPGRTEAVLAPQAQLAGSPDAKRVQEEKQEAQPRDEGGHYLLCAHYAERMIDRVLLKEGCGEPVCEANHICETVVYSLTAMADCPPGLASCPESGWEPGPSGAEIRRWERPEAAGAAALAALGDRGPHSTLVRWSMDRSEGGEPCCEPALPRGRDGFAFDPDAGVPLACVTIGYRCGDPYVEMVVDAVGPRRLTRPNDVLFDLIRGCDLTRIRDVGWRGFVEAPEGKVSFEEYSQMFVGGGSGARTPAAVDTRFWVLFSGPVQIASLSPHAIAITLLHWDSDEAVRLVRRLPVTGIKVAPTAPGDPPGSTRAFLPIVHGNYWLEEIFSTSNAYDEREGTFVEIGVRGGLIVDVAGQLVAGGGGYLETRPGWPGSDFISIFTVNAPARRAAAPARRRAR
jgi:hypothetical protein